MGSMLKTAMGALALFLIFVVNGVGAKPAAVYSTVFIAPPATAGLGTNGSDSDGTNCTRFAPAVLTPPGGVGYGCASFQKAYSLAQPGDTVFLNWNGAWATGRQPIGPSGNKSSSGGCNYPVDVTGCINFTPGPGLTPSLTSAGIRNQGATLGICADYVELSNLTFNGGTWTDQYGDTLSNTTWGVGTGDNTCQPSGQPPHDIFIKNVVSNGPIGVVGGANRVYVLGGAIQNSLNFPPQFAGSALVNGTQTPVTNHNTIDGVLFNNISGNDSVHHHMVCLHLDGGSDSITIKNSHFENCSNGPYASIRVEAEGGVPSHTNLVIENNFLDAGVPVSINCHSNNCVLRGITVRFNTFANGGFLLTNDCALLRFPTCMVQDNFAYGNIVNNACPRGGAAYGAGWTESYNVWAGKSTTDTICSGDRTSLFGKVVRLRAPGPPAYDDHLVDCAQPGTALVPPTVPGRPATDPDGDLLPPNWLAGAGADQCDTSLMVLGKSIGAARIGEAQADVVTSYGPPRSTTTVAYGTGRLRRLLFRAHGATIWVLVDARQSVVGVGTTSPYYESATGLSVGADAGQVRAWGRTEWLVCRSAYHRRGPVGVYVALAGGQRGRKITGIAFVRNGNGYEVCPAKPKQRPKKR